MTNLKKFTLVKDPKKDDWALKQDKTGRVTERFDTKAEATRGGILEKAVGPYGGSVKIKTEKGKIQEERTYPGNKDPARSKG